jgi:hypothetical protein
LAIVGPSSYLRSVLLARAVGTGLDVGGEGNRGGGGVRQDIESGCRVRQEVRQAVGTGMGGQAVGLAAGSGGQAGGVRLQTAGVRRAVRRVAGVSGRRGSDGRCVRLLTAEVRRVMRLAVDGEGQACSASGCRGQRAAWSGGRCVGLPAWGEVVRQWVWLRAAGSGGKCVRLRMAGVRREVHRAADCGG